MELQKVLHVDGGTGRVNLHHFLDVLLATPSSLMDGLLGADSNYSAENRSAGVGANVPEQAKRARLDNAALGKLRREFQCLRDVLQRADSEGRLRLRSRCPNPWQLRHMWR